MSRYFVVWAHGCKIATKGSRTDWGAATLIYSKATSKRIHSLSVLFCGEIFPRDHHQQQSSRFKRSRRPACGQQPSSSAGRAPKPQPFIRVWQVLAVQQCLEACQVVVVDEAAQCALINGRGPLVLSQLRRYLPAPPQHFCYQSAHTTLSIDAVKTIEQGRSVHIQHNAGKGLRSPKQPSRCFAHKYHPGRAASQARTACPRTPPRSPGRTRCAAQTPSGNQRNHRARPSCLQACTRTHHTHLRGPCSSCHGQGWKVAAGDVTCTGQRVWKSTTVHLNHAHAVD